MDNNRISLAGFSLPDTSATIYLQVGEEVVAIFTNPSYGDLIDTVQWAVNLIIDERPFISHPLKVIFCDLAIAKVFTNLKVEIPSGATENDVYLIYEALKGAKILEEVSIKVNKEKLAFLVDSISETVSSILTYRNSARGVINILAAEAQNNSETFAKTLRMYSDEGNLQEVSRLMKVVEALGQTQPQS